MKSFINHTFSSKSVIVVGFPSCGNVGQMAVDCLLSSVPESRLRRVGTLESDLLGPVSGYERFHPSSKPSLCLPIEVYSVLDSEVFIIQIRAPCLPGKQEAFVSDLVACLEALVAGSDGGGGASVLLLSGAQAVDSAGHIQRCSKVFYSTSPTSLARAETAALSSLLEEHYQPLPHLPQASDAAPSHGVYGAEGTFDCFDLREEDTWDDVGADGAEGRYVWGMPMAESVLREVGRRKSELNVTVVGKYCFDGENRAEAYEMAAVVGIGLGLLIPSSTGSVPLRDPASWRHLFGQPVKEPAISIF